MRIRLLIILLVIAAGPSVLFAQASADKSPPLDLTWEMLADVKIVLKDKRYMPAFGADVVALSGKEVKIRGYIVPLEQGKTHTYFMISANPISSCFFCGGAGPESMAEVRTGTAVDFGYDPINIIGTLKILEDDPLGLFYSIADARQVE